MANMKELLPKGEYTIKNVGPSRNWEFSGNNGTVKMATDSVQFEGYEQYWVDVNRAQDKPAPTIGEVLKGSVEQDEQAKYAPKFAKEKGGGGWSGGGGGKASPGAIWAQNVQTATEIVVGFYTASGKKPKTFDEFLGKIKAVAPKVGSMVDEFVGKAPKAEAPDTASSESGETPAPASAPATAAPKADLAVEDISDEELGDW